MATVAQARRAIEVLEARGDIAGAAAIRRDLDAAGLSASTTDFEAQVAAERQQRLERQEQAREASLQRRIELAELDRGAIDRGLDIGTDLIGQATGSTLEGVGGLLGLEGLEQYGAEVALENEADIQRKARFQTRLDDVEDVGSFGSFLGGLAAESAPQMGSSIAGGIAGAKLGAVFGPVGALVGGIAGGAAANLPFFYGMNRERQKDAIDQGLRTEIDEGAAALTAIPQAALDSIVDRLLVGGLGFTSRAVGGGGIFTRGVKGAGTGAVTEATTEVGQQLLERAQAGLPIANEEAIAEYREAAIAGGLLGGSIRGTTTVFGGDVAAREDAEIEAREQLRRDNEAAIARGELQMELPLVSRDGTPIPTAEESREAPAEDGEQLRRDSEAAEISPDQLSLPGLEPPVQLTDEEVATRLAGVSEEQLADSIKRDTAPAGTQLELTDVPRAETEDQLADTLDVEEVRERVFKGFSESAKQKPLDQLTAKQKATIAKRAQKLEPAEFAALEEVLAQEAAVRQEAQQRSAEAAQETFPSPAVGPQLQGLPSPESEPITVTSEGEATTEQQRRRTDTLAEVRQQQLDAEQAARDVVTGDMPEAEVRLARERDAVAERTQPDLFPSELVVAEEAATEPEVAPAAEPLRITSQTLDSLAIPARAPIRKEIPEGASLDDPAISPRTGNPLPTTVRERLVRYGRNRGSKAVQDSIDNLLQGEPDGTSTRQRDLPTRAKREPDEAGDRTGTGSDTSGLEFTPRGADSTEAATSDGDTVADAGGDAGRVDARTGAESDTLADELNLLVNTEDRSPEQESRFLELITQAREQVKAPKEGVVRRKRSIKEVQKQTEPKPVELESKEETELAALQDRVDQAVEDSKSGEQTKKKSPSLAQTKEAQDVREAVQDLRENDPAYAGLGYSVAKAKYVQEQASEATVGTRTTPDERAKYLMNVKDMEPDIRMAMRSTAPPMFGTGNVIYDVDAPLADSVMSRINAGDVRGALQELAKTTKDRRAARVARKLLNYVGTTQVDVVNMQPISETTTLREADNLASMVDALKKYGQKPLGLFVPSENRILLNTSGGLNGVTFLHEMTHAATLYELKTKPNSTTVKDLNKIYEAAKEVLGADPYGTTNLEEFVAEAFANPEFQRELAKINAKGERLSLFQRFKARIARFLGLDSYDGNKLIGGDESAQAEVNRLVDKILAAAPARAGLDNVPSLSVKDGVQQVSKAMVEAAQSKLSSKERRAKIKRDFLAVFSKEDNPRLKRLMTGILGILPNQPIFNEIAEAVGISDADLVGKAILEQRGALSESEAAVKAVLDPIVRWSTSASKATLDAFNNLVHDSTVDEVDPSITPEQAKKRYGKKTVDGKKDGQLKIDRYNELRAVYNSATFTAEGRKKYIELRDLYAGINDELRRSLLGRIDGLAVDEAVKTSLRNDLFARLMEISNIEPYFPLTRKGKYWLAVRNPADGEFAVVTYESMGDRKAARERFEGEGYSVEVIDPDNMKQYVGADAPSGSFVTQVLNTLNAKGVPQSAKEQIARLYIEALPETSFTKSLLKRKKTLGYDIDAIGAARSKAYDLARQSARIRSSNKIEAVMNAVEEQFRERKVDAEGNPTREFVRPDLQNDRAEAVLTEMKDRANFAVNPPADNFAKNANRMAFLWTIGGNASSALVNLSQIPLFAYPMLGGIYGYKKTGEAMKNAAKLFSSAYVPHARENFSNDPQEGKKFSEKYTIPSIDNYYTRTNELGSDGKPTGRVIYSVRTDLDIPQKRKDELELIRPLIELAAKRGELNTSFLAETLSVDQSGRETNMWDKITSYSALMFHTAEVMNRQTAMVMAYNLELDKLTNGDPEKATEAQKQEAAEEALFNTQQINGGATLETGPRHAREFIGRIALMYKGYGIQMYYTMFKTGKQLIFNLAPGNDAESRALRNQAFKQLAGIHLSAVFFAGLQGIPIYGLVSMIYDMFQDDYEEDADEAFRSYLDNDVLYKGLLSEMTGLDVSQRVKLTDLLFEADKFNTDPSPEESFGHYFGGPAWSVTSRAIEGLGEIMDGEVERGAEAMMPGAVRNLYKGIYRYPRDEGILTRRGDPIYDDITAGDMLTQILGFPPVGYTREIEETSAAKGMESAARAKRSKLMKRYYIATRFGDTEEARNVMKEIIEFNREDIIRVDPKLRISPDSIERSMRRHRTTTAKMHNGVLLSPYMKSAVESVGYL